jgi:hypothetical protein
MHRAVEQISMAAAFLGSRDFQLIFANSIASVVLAHANSGNLPGTVSAASRVEAFILEGPFSSDAEFDIVRLKVWRVLAFAKGGAGDLPGCLAAALEVEKLANSDRLRARSEGPREYAEALVAIVSAHSRRADVESTLKAVSVLRDFVARFPLTATPQIDALLSLAAGSLAAARRRLGQK